MHAYSHAQVHVNSVGFILWCFDNLPSGSKCPIKRHYILSTTYLIAWSCGPLEFLRAWDCEHLHFYRHVYMQGDLLPCFTCDYNSIEAEPKAYPEWKR